MKQIDRYFTKLSYIFLKHEILFTPTINFIITHSHLLLLLLLYYKFIRCCNHFARIRLFQSKTEENQMPFVAGYKHKNYCKKNNLSINYDCRKVLLLFVCLFVFLQTEIEIIKLKSNSFIFCSRFLYFIYYLKYCKFQFINRFLEIKL